MTKTTNNFPKFLLLWSGELISAIGSGLTSFGLGVYVYQTTHSAASMAMVTLAGFLPSLLLSPFAGILADKWDRRLLIMTGDGLSALSILYIWLCIRQGHVTLAAICAGLVISALFSALLEPAYKATITDLLTKEQYAKASGLVSLAGSARYLVSPMLAGFILHASGIETLLLIDVCTFFPTVLAAAFVRKEMGSQQAEISLSGSWQVILHPKGLPVLVFLSAAITFFMGCFQILAQPMILSFADSTVLGTAETVCASGMLVTSLYVGIKGIRHNYVDTLSVSLVLAGLMMILFSMQDNIFLMGISGFLFFGMLPYANTSLDYLVRTNIDGRSQGRAWGLIGFISQTGYVAAYLLAGTASDLIAKVSSLSVGRSAALVVMAAGLAQVLTAIILWRLKSVRQLQEAA